MKNEQQQQQYKRAAHSNHNKTERNGDSQLHIITKTMNFFLKYAATPGKPISVETNEFFQSAEIDK